MFNGDLKARRNKFLADVKKNRKRYLTLGLVSVFLFLTFLYLGPFNGLEKLGLIGQKKEGQESKAAAIRGNVGDFWADTVLGQPNFSEISPNSVVANKVNIPLGAVIDRSSTPQKLYIYDAGNSRILGLNWDNCLALAGACSAEKVIGQPNLNSGACNGDGQFQNFPTRASATASTLCGIKEDSGSPAETIQGVSMAVDASGNLHTVDYFNHRVLKYNRPFETDSIADDVWGQDNFSGNLVNKGRTSADASSFFFSQGVDNNSTAGVDLDSAGNLWVADSGNSRVLRFPPSSKTADLVLGQPDFTSHYSGNALNQFLTPTVVRMGSSGFIYVADGANHRILRFRAPFTNGMNGEVFGSGFIKPMAIDLDPTSPERLWIRDVKKALLELWDETSATRMGTIGVLNDFNLLGSLDAAGSTAVDRAGNVVVAVIEGDTGQDVLLFAKGGSTTIPTKRLFNANRNIPNLVTSSEFGRAVNGVAASTVDDQLIVASSGRILFWNGLSSITNGKPADGYVGGITNKVLSGINDYDPFCCAVIKADKNHHLWVITLPNSGTPSRILLYQLPLTNAAVPTQVITLPLNVLGGGQINFANLQYFLWGIAPTDASEFLWLSFKDSSRVIRIRNPLAINRIVDVVLGQTDLVGTLCNRGAPKVTGATPDSLCQPGPLSIDHLGNLWVSDHSLENEGNWRLLEFNSSLFPTNNTSVIYAPAASKIFPSTAAWEPTFDSQNHMVVGYNYQGPRTTDYSVSFPGFYSNPLGASTTADGYLKDFTSNAFAATFDSSDNLYMADLNRARVLVYKNPFNTGVPSPSPAPTSSPSPTPLPSPTASLVPTPSPALGDTQSPNVAIASPLNGSTISGKVTISAVASDNVGVTRMEIYVDGGLKSGVNFVTSLSYRWNTSPRSVGSGSHNITAKAYDASGNVGMATITVNKVK